MNALTTMRRVRGQAESGLIVKGNAERRIRTRRERVVGKNRVIDPKGTAAVAGLPPGHRCAALQCRDLTNWIRLPAGRRRADRRAPDFGQRPPRPNELQREGRDCGTAEQLDEFTPLQIGPGIYRNVTMRNLHPSRRSLVAVNLDKNPPCALPRQKAKRIFMAARAAGR